MPLDVIVQVGSGDHYLVEDIGRRSRTTSPRSLRSRPPLPATRQSSHPGPNTAPTPPRAASYPSDSEKAPTAVTIARTPQAMRKRPPRRRSDPCSSAAEVRARVIRASACSTKAKQKLASSRERANARRRLEQALGPLLEGGCSYSMTVTYTAF
jgi:hypothetical protein